MKRLEIIANRSVQDDLFDRFDKKGIGCCYTILPVVHGVGNSGPRKGDSVWPEENFLVILYCDEAEAAPVRETVEGLKKDFPDEGIRLFELG